MEINSDFRLSWKSRVWNMRRLAIDADVEIPASWERKHFRREKRPSRDSEDHDEQVYEQGITFPCSICKCEIDLPGIFSHKKQHVALATLGFQWMGGKKPEPSVIAIQRQFIITKLLSSFMFSEKFLQSINNAFELLWKKQIPAYYKIIDNIHRSSIYSQKICHLLIKGVAICEDRNSTWKVDMNDKFTVVNNFGNKPNVCFFGLFDGHHGASAADLSSMELPVLLLQQLSRLDPSYQMTPEEQKVIDSFHTVFTEEYTALEDIFSTVKKWGKALGSEYENIHKAFAKAFWRMDRLLRLGRKEVSRVRWSGCSAVTCILEGNTESPNARKTWRRINDHYSLAERFSSQTMPRIISGVLHIANTGSVQAVLCRNGKGFCLTKEHTTRNIKERRRVLENGAIISPNEPYGLLEGQIKTTRGLGFHGNLKLKKFIIPAPQTISVPIDDLCQFLILATNGLWEVLDKKEVTALAMTMFQVYKETYCSITQNKSSPSKGPLFCPINEPSITKSESNIHILFQYKSESKECVSNTNSKENLSDSKYSKCFTCNPKNEQTFPPEMTHRDPCSDKETDGRTNVDGVPKDSSEKEKESRTKGFYEGAAEYISHELVNAALAAGSRDNITVMVILLNGSEYQFSDIKDKVSIIQSTKT
ncbi:PREDICTED: protein phosphatase 2C-like domain-containing protein 1 [Ceratotherium simum simum]|uniref:Protein phosphatase 2C-like domain-containing protein 1 n=1 Tax=Ceratotherium simum simum TaxID=73337 RepID=A0ABM0H5J2_CERSS|nr:PREDICTED: protein phosphatase 2C-like domain-containing protein 1 [Ceratotherium simum simum]